MLNENGKTVNWDTDTIPMKDSDTLNPLNAFVEVYLAEN
jgi:hypothetical protein